MSLNHILNKFDTIGVFEPGMDISINQDFLGSAEIAKMMGAILDTDNLKLTAQSYDRPIDNSLLRLSATSTILNINDAIIDFYASEENSVLKIKMEITIPNEWKFSQSFPDLPKTWFIKVKSDSVVCADDAVQQSFLDDLSLGASKLVFSNIAYHDNELNADFLPGINFVGELYFMGALFGYNTLTGSDGPVHVSGPINEYRLQPDPKEFLGIRLGASIPVNSSFTAVQVSNSEILVKGALSEGQVDQNIGLTQQDGVYMLATVSIDSRPLQLVCQLQATDQGSMLSMFGLMKDFSLSGFSSLSQSTGGTDLDTNLPDNLQAPSGLQLTQFGLNVDFKNYIVQSLMVGVGCKTEWEIIADILTLQEIGVTFTISSPFDSKNRSLITTLSGLFDIKGIKIAVFADVPGLRFGGGLPEGETIPLGQLLETYIPSAPQLPDMTINKLIFDVDTKNRSFAINTAITDLLSIPVGETEFEIKNIFFALSYNKTAGATGAFCTEMTIADGIAVLAGDLTDQLELTGNFQNFNLQTFFTAVTGGDKLPEEVPDITFDNITIKVTPTSGDFSIIGMATIDWDKLPFEGTITTDVEFSFAVDKTKDLGSSKTAIDARLSLQGTGPAGFTDDFIMKNFNFLFEYKTNKGWKLGGGTTVDIFDHELYLQASYEDSKILGKIFQLTTKTTPEVKLISLEGVGYYSFSQLDLKVNRKEVEGGKDQTYWNFRLDSTLAIDNVFTVAGFLSIFDQEDGRKGLLFNPDKGTAAAKIDFPGTGSGGVNISLFEAGFTKESAEAGWGFTGTVDVAFSNMPGWMDELLPSTLHAKLVAGKKNVGISAVRVTDAMPIVLPKIDGKSMGTIYFQLTEVGIAVKPSAGLVLEAGLGFSQEVNNMFGGNQIFRVYEQGNILTLARTKFTINQSGISAQFITSPFAGANAVVINGESWFDVSFGKYGAIRLKMPTFKYDGVTQYFEAGGGVEVTKPLAIPLTPIKMLLEGVELKAAADVLPDSIPIKSIDIVDKKGNFKIDDLIKLLESAGKIPGEIKDILKATGNLLDRFPDTFKQYFNFVVPEKLEFKFGFSPTGRITFGLKTGKTPIRVLQSAMVQGVVPMPGFYGIELREISLGTIASGSLFQLTIDGHVDTYDLATLALSLAMPTDKAFPLPTSDELQRRLVMKNVFMIIPLQAGVPIPIPIFYDQVGLEYLGIEGVGLQGHIGLPSPELSGLPQFFSTLKKFFSDRKYLLDPKTPPGVDIQFNLGNNYFQLPEYLGGKVLGIKDKPVTISVWSGLAHALNFMKTISVNELIQAIPIKNRVGSAESSFAFFNFNADWLITTPKEFRDGAYKKMKLSKSDKKDFVAVLPTVASSTGSQNGGNEEGIVVFMRGEADISIVKLEAVFGLAASGTMGFATGFKFTGTLAKIIEMEIGGAVAINAPKIDESGSFSLPEPPALPAADVAELPPGTPLALAFDGSNSQVKIPDHGNLNFKGSFTIETWVKFSKFDKTWQAIVTKGDDAWRLHRYGNSNKISFGSSGLSNSDLASKQILKVGQWYHIAAVYTGKKKLLYINGELDNAIDVTGTLNASNYPTMIWWECA